MMLDKELYKNKKQRGFVLAVSMIFLVIMTLLAVTAINKTILEEKIVGNLRSQDVAFEAAERALRFCERQISLAVGDRNMCNLRPGALVPEYESGEPNFANALENFPNEWAQANNWTDAGSKPAFRMPVNTADSMIGVVSQPQCMIEKWSVQGNRSDNIQWAYVVTSRGVGNVDTAVVMLQTIIRCGNY